MPTYYIYGLVDPTTNEIRYIGLSRTPTRRLHQHCSFARKPNSRMAASEWIAELLARQLIPALITLEEYSAEWRSEARDVEIQWINHYWNEGAPLLNRHRPRQRRRYSRLLPGRDKTRLKLDPVRGWHYEDDN